MKLLKQTHSAIRAVSTIALVSILTACGGGGDTNDGGNNGGGTNGSDTQPPAVTAPANITVAATDESGTAISEDAISAFLGAATVTDNVDSNLDITIDAPNVFPMGVTTITFSATDTANNTGSAQATVTITDQTPPVITLNGDSEVTLNLSELYIEQGAQALDNVDGVLTTDVAGTVDINLDGTYTLTYSVTDAAGNPAISITRQVIVGSGGSTAEECATGVATKDGITHDCNYTRDDIAQGNFRMKYPGGEWLSIGCSGGKPVADNSNTQWVQKERTIRIIGGDYLKCGELDKECTCETDSFERFHGISPDYVASNNLTHAVDYPGGGYVFNNSAHQTCLGIHKQGDAGEIESIWSVFNSNHDHQESSGDHKECPLFCLGDACP